MWHPTHSTFRLRLYPRDSRNTHYDAEDDAGGQNDGVPRTPVFCGEDLGRDSVEHTVHDVVRERVAAVPAQEGVGRPSGRAREQKYASQCYGQRISSARGR